MTFLDDFNSYPDGSHDDEFLDSEPSLARIALTTRRLPGDDAWLVWDTIKGLDFRDRYGGSCFYDDKANDTQRTIVFVCDKKHTLSFLGNMRNRIADLTAKSYTGRSFLDYYNQMMAPDYQPRDFLLASVDVNKYSSISYMMTDSITEAESKYLAQIKNKEEAPLNDAIKCFFILNENSSYPVVGNTPGLLSFSFKEILRSPSHVMRPVLDYMFKTKDKNIHRQFEECGLGKYVVL